MTQANLTVGYSNDNERYIVRFSNSLVVIYLIPSKQIHLITDLFIFNSVSLGFL